MREVAPGKWKLRVFLGTDPVTNAPLQKQRTVQARDETEARRHLNRLLAEAETSDVRSHRRGPADINDLLSEYVALLKAKDRAPTTLHEAERIRDRVIGPLIGRVRLEELTPRHLYQLYARLKDGDADHKPQSAASLQRYHAVLSAALNMAVNYGWIRDNPALRASGRPPVTPRAIEVPQAEDVQRFVAAAVERDPKYGTLTVLAILTASRRGEFCDLRWTDLDHVNSVIRIRRSLYRAGSERGEKDAKGHRERRIPVISELATVLAAWRRRCEAMASDAGVELVPDAFIVSPFPDGSRPINPDALSTFQSRLAKELGIRLEGRNPFRHWGAMEILGSGVSARDGADLLGHSDGRTFLGRCTHAANERQRNAAAVLGKVVAMIASEGDLEA